LEHLELPKFNPNENPRQIKQDLMFKQNDELFEKEKAEAKKKRDLINQRLQEN